MTEVYNFKKTLKPVLGMIVHTGTLPERYPSLQYRIRGWITVTALSLLTSSCVATTIMEIKDMDNAIYALCMGLVAFHSISKHIIINTNQERMYQILKFLQDPVFTAHGSLSIYITWKIRFCSLVRHLQMYSAWCTVTLILLTPVFGLSDRILAIPFPVNMKDQPIYLYLLVWFMQSFLTFFSAWITPGCNGVVVYIIGIIAAQLRILREKILHCADGTAKNKNFDKIVNSRLRNCIIHHIAIEKYTKVAENMLMYYFLVQVLVSLLTIVFVGFTAAISPLTSPNFGRGMVFLIALIIELANFCVIGNDIILQSEKIRDACYMSEWTKCGPTVRKTLFIIMEKSKRPLKLTAAKFVVMSLVSLLSVLKSSFSYFTILRQMYAEPNKM